MGRRSTQRRDIADIFRLLAILLLLGGSSAIGFWRSIPAEGQTLILVAGMTAIICGTGALVMFSIYRKRQRAAAWQRAMAAWKQSQKIDKSYEALSIHHLSPYDLEKFAAQVYSKMGYRVTHTGRSGDHGIDVKLINPKGQIEVVQCKQWNKPVGEPEVRNLAGSMVAEKAIRGFLWAPKGFTTGAQRWAKGKPIVLADEREIGRLIESTYTS